MGYFSFLFYTDRTFTKWKKIHGDSVKNESTRAKKLEGAPV